MVIFLHHLNHSVQRTLLKYQILYKIENRVPSNYIIAPIKRNNLLLFLPNNRRSRAHRPVNNFNANRRRKKKEETEYDSILRY